MNDRYLFKAKTTVKENPNEAFNNIWVRGFLVVNNGKYYIHPIANKFLITGNLGQNVVMHEVDSSTLCQCTGLKDRAKQIIFEKDIVVCDGCVGIVKFGYYEWSTSENIGFYIEWEEVYFRKDLAYWLDKIKVVGSAIDNPELLEVE